MARPLLFPRVPNLYIYIYRLSRFFHPTRDNLEKIKNKIRSFSIQLFLYRRIHRSPSITGDDLKVFLFFFLFSNSWKALATQCENNNGFDGNIVDGLDIPLYDFFYSFSFMCTCTPKLSLNGLRYSMQDKRHERSFPSRLIFDMHGLLVERIRLEGIYEYTLGGMDKN